MEDLSVIEEAISYRFQQEALLLEAVTHRSYVNENRESAIRDNETLEFLGDAALGLAVSEILLERFPGKKEGDLSKLRASLINEAGCAAVARSVGLGDFLRLGKGEQRTGGREKPSLIANAWEAVVGAVFLDGGYSAARDVVRKFFVPLVEDDIVFGTDWKTALQEVLQKKTGDLPVYRITETIGPLHDQLFVVSVFAGDEFLGEGEGKSKKDAEQKAARAALTALRPGAGVTAADEGPCRS